jgi:hypothetical protein
MKVLAKIGGIEGSAMDDVDFIKLNFADAEGTVRAYDTKSQIVLASCALSFNPIVAAIKQVDTTPWLNVRLDILFTLFALVLLMFLRVLGPASGAGKKLGGATGGLFFLRDPSSFVADTYLEALSKADLKLEYANEVLSLHRIRIIKQARFKFALYMLTGYFGLVFLYGLALLTHIF